MSDTIKQCLHCKPYDKMYPGKKDGSVYVRESYKFWLEFIDPNDTKKLNELFPNQSYKHDFENNICPFCKYELKDTLLTYDEFVGIRRYSNNNKEFLFAMIELRKKDVIEFETKMQPVRQLMEQQEEKERKFTQEYFEALNNSPKCPTCGSSNVHKINGLERGTSVMMLGLFSKKINKSYKCNNCNYTW